MYKPILLRSHSVHNDLLSSFGADVKETRVTGYLAYLIFQRPSNLLNILNINDNKIISIKIEHALETQRCDIVVETEKKLYLIEAKLFYEDPTQQLLKQKNELAKQTTKRIKLIGITNNRFIKNKKITLLTWKDIYNSLEKVSNARIQILSEEFKMHLFNKGLVLVESPEIYARELGYENTILMFLKGQSYTCKYPRSSQIEKCKYFTPHFGR